MRFPCSYAQTGLYLIYPKASSKIKEVCKIAVIKILCNDTNIHGRNTGAYVHMHTYIQAHARTRTRLISKFVLHHKHKRNVTKRGV